MLLLTPSDPRHFAKIERERKKYVISHFFFIRERKHYVITQYFRDLKRRPSIPEYERPSSCCRRKCYQHFEVDFVRAVTDDLVYSRNFSIEDRQDRMLLARKTIFKVPPLNKPCCLRFVMKAFRLKSKNELFYKHVESKNYVSKCDTCTLQRKIKHDGRKSNILRNEATKKLNEHYRHIKRERAYEKETQNKSVLYPEVFCIELRTNVSYRLGYRISHEN